MDTAAWQDYKIILNFVMKYIKIISEKVAEEKTWTVFHQQVSITSIMGSGYIGAYSCGYGFSTGDYLASQHSNCFSI